MNCPVCGKEMVEKDFGNVIVDFCQKGCKSMWFDWFELSRLDEYNEGFGKALDEALDYPRVNDSERGKIKCPKCGIPMHIHKYEGAKEVNVDECYGCGGFFLDSGELNAIRENFMSESERQEYVDSLVEDIPEYKQMQEENEKKQCRKKAIGMFARYF